jgi:hypothetical protein
MWRLISDTLIPPKPALTDPQLRELCRIEPSQNPSSDEGLERAQYGLF